MEKVIMNQAKLNPSLINTLKDKTRNLSFIYRVRKFLKFISPRVQIFNIINQLYLLLLLTRRQYYQPLYNFAIVKKKQPERICLDRADVIYQDIKAWGQGGHILDIGCNLGYFSHYFADRGYQVDGIDTNPNSIAICNLLQRINEKKTQFSVTEFSDVFLKKLPSNQYDAAFLFSVIHHIIYARGMDYAQQLMKLLLDKIPVLFIELAINKEATKSPWRETLGDDELAVFAQCSDITIQKMGYFLTPKGIVRRPLYKVMRNTLTLCGKNFKIAQRKFSAYQGCHYYDCGDQYVKSYALSQQRKITQEIEHLERLPKNDFFPALLANQKNNGRLEMLLTKLPGENLFDLLAKGQSVPALKIFKNTVAGLKFLLTHGLYHNNVRLWNMMFDGEKTYFFNLDSASAEEKEPTTLALLWMIAQLHEFNDYTLQHPLNTAPQFKLESMEPEFQSIVNALQKARSLKEFLPI